MNEPETRALLAATLALMTHFSETRCPFAGEKIRDNLLRLSAIQALPWEFRTLAAKLGARWSLLQEEARSLALPAAVRH